MNINMPTSLAGGRYQLGQLVGRGGMAEVHVATDTRLGRTVAVKLRVNPAERTVRFVSVLIEQKPAFYRRFGRRIVTFVIVGTLDRTRNRVSHRIRRNVLFRSPADFFGKLFDIFPRTFYHKMRVENRLGIFS